MSNKSCTTTDKRYEYQQGFGNEFQTEAIPNALPQHQNNPQRCPHNLYAEQISGSAFTTRRSHNLRTWVYRMQPSVSSYMQDHPWHEFEGKDGSACFGGCDWKKDLKVDPNPIRWGPPPSDVSTNQTDHDKMTFIRGFQTYAGTGDPTLKSGLAIYMYTFNANMSETTPRESFYNSDGDFLIVPQRGTLRIQTELGILVIEPNEICVIPRGIVYCVDLLDGDDNASGVGYVLEVFGGHFTLPELGPIGANCLASPRDFYYPVAHFSQSAENLSDKHVMYNKVDNTLFRRFLPSSYNPFNVVAWHGNYSPFKYNLLHFCTINSVSYDHPDPSIYTVLTVQDGGHGGDESGEASADFVVFPPRWLVSEHTFRPPYFHRNCMTEFMGLIYGSYDGKQAGKPLSKDEKESSKKGGGFQPGGCSFHPCMCPHGPDQVTFEKASAGDVSKPMKLDQGLAFMFETKMIVKISEYGRNCSHRENDYVKCWGGFKNYFAKEQGKDKNESVKKMRLE